MHIYIISCGILKQQIDGFFYNFHGRYTLSCYHFKQPSYLRSSHTDIHLCSTGYPRRRYWVCTCFKKKNICPDSVIDIQKQVSLILKDTYRTFSDHILAQTILIRQTEVNIVYICARWQEVMKANICVWWPEITNVNICGDQRNK